ncbi:hypothetical protein [Prauserella cavernicola]|uniref:Uncharacterized protein n=1 Tax=Prauserella cavernicola TaxID=2800127 RepID=A0A934QW91_9PSEU|nr:hypothetical protein [Prauserella cavernicola]MBK1787686.1 hypothetical protein [Prauserella cavernicola]
MPVTGASGADAARARVALSHDACELAERARALVPARDHEPGATLAEALGVLAAARRLCASAAEFERLHGASRDELGAALARARDGSGDTSWWREHLLRHPLEAALDLDDWVRHHTDGDDPGPAPVSGILAHDNGHGHAAGTAP